MTLEFKPHGEDDAIEDVVEALQAQMREDYPPGRVRRDAHPKMHGCVQAELVVDPELPAHFRHGVFSNPGSSHRGWVRFSNAFRVQPDLKADGRGMAMKLIDVKGGPFLGDEHATQDFLAATHDAFFVPDAIAYVDFPQASAGGVFSTIWFFIRRRLWRGLRALYKSANTLAMNPLAITYFSQVPYALGPLVVKFQFRPLLTDALGRSLPWKPLFWIKTELCTAVLIAGEMVGLDRLATAICAWVEDPNFLRREMARALEASDAWFELLVQQRVDGMPVEDATVRWDQERSPYHRVAWVQIPRQVFAPDHVIGEPRKSATQEMETLGENISLSPWHALTEHRPLGGINRARRKATAASSHLRHTLNKMAPVVPTVAEFERLASLIRLGPGAVAQMPPPEGVATGSAARFSGLRYLYLRRVPLLAALAFTIFPLASLWWWPSLLTRPMYEIPWVHLYLVSFLAFLLAFTVMTTWWIITAYSDRRCGAARMYAVYPIRAHWFVASGLLTVPTLIATVQVADRSAWVWWHWTLWIRIWLEGLAVALLLMWAARWLADQLDSAVWVSALAKWLSRRPNLGEGYVDRDRGSFLRGQLFAAAVAAVSGLMYATLGGLTLGANASRFPSLVSLLVLLTVVCWLSGVTFFLDRFRVPVLLPIVLFAVLGRGVRGADHVFPLLDTRSPSDRLLPHQALVAHRPDKTPRKGVIVVAAGGGGLQSSAWAVRVLTGLEEKARQQNCHIDDAIKVISATSSGAVAAMHFINAYHDGRLPWALDFIQDEASRSVEDPLWREFVYRDIYRPLRVLTARASYADRGLALENAWQRALGGALLSSWIEDVRSGRRPGAIFNATVAESRKRVAISTAGTPGAYELDFDDLYSDHDLRVVTACRLSAAFPVVSPLARDGLNMQRGVHLVDGGYSDLYSIVSLVDWLDNALSDNEPQNPRVERVLILQLRSHPPVISTNLPVPDWPGQLERDQKLIELLRDKWKGRVNISSVAFELHDTPSIAWRVTAQQRKAIDTQWGREQNGDDANTVVRFLKTEQGCPPD